MALLVQAASRRTTNSKPSQEMSVTYLLGPEFWLVDAIAVMLMVVVHVGKKKLVAWTEKVRRDLAML